MSTLNTSASFIKAFQYPIAIDINVSNCVHLADDWRFDIEFTSNITTWDIRRTLSQFKQLDADLHGAKELFSIKLPRSVPPLPDTRMQQVGTQLISDYVWKLLRRAFVLISPVVTQFIELPIIVETHVSQLSEQLCLTLREDTLSCSSAATQNKYTQVRCVLGCSYVLDAFKVVPNEWKRDAHTAYKHHMFRIDCVCIKRVIRYQKEHRFAIEIRGGHMYDFKCVNQSQFDDWIQVLKRMIKAQDGYTPYIARYNGKTMDQSVMDDRSVLLDYLDDDFFEHGPLSTMESMLSNVSLRNSPESETKEQTLYDASERVSIDIESCFDQRSWSPNREHRAGSLPQLSTIDPIVHIDPIDEAGSLDPIESTLGPGSLPQPMSQPSVRTALPVEVEASTHYSYDFEEEQDTKRAPHVAAESTTLQMQQESLAKQGRDSIAHRQILQKQHKVLRSSALATNSAALPESEPLVANNIPAHQHMIPADAYAALLKELGKWKSKANRWHAMAVRHEENHASVQLRLQRKETKYKAKIKDQQNQILSLTQIVKHSQMELEGKLMQLQQMESASNFTIQQLVNYKRTNEMRKKNSYIDGTLWKFTGDGMNNIKFGKAPKLKYVMYVPTKHRLYYSDSQHDDADTKLINVTFVSHQTDDKLMQVPDRYKHVWIKIVGQNRIVLFVAKNEKDAKRWYETINNSLNKE